ncbi:MAG TPA: EamA family transporter [Candidatus Sulfotelmatobacter sp.]|nr:EamA family transporter [Candidatus Sulfotelmatobacter sp.]
MHQLPGWLWFAAIALVFWGITGVTQKLATNKISSELSFIWFAYAMIAISVTLAVFVPMHWHVRPVIFWAAVAGGTLNGLGALTSFTALESGGKASVVISLISLYPLVTVAFAVAVLHEHLSLTQGLGVGLAIIAAILLSLEPKAADVKS